MVSILLSVALVAATSPTPDEARRAADEILRGAEFQEPPQSIPDRILEWISARLADLFVNLASGGSGSVLTWLVLAVFAGIVGFIVYRVVRTLRPDPLVRRHDVDGQPDRTPADWRAEATRFEAAGSWKAALRARYRALVGDLVARGVVRDVPGRTTGEYRQEVSVQAPAVAADFAAASALFDAAWYGDVATGADENARFRALSDRVVAGIRRGESTTAADGAHHDAGVPA